MDARRRVSERPICAVGYTSKKKAARALTSSSIKSEFAYLLEPAVAIPGEVSVAKADFAHRGLGAVSDVVPGPATPVALAPDSIYGVTQKRRRRGIGIGLRHLLPHRVWWLAQQQQRQQHRGNEAPPTLITEWYRVQAE